MNTNQLRSATAQILAVDGKHRLSRLADGVLITLISLNVIAIILESMASFKAQHHTALAAFDTFSVVVFTIEYILRLWSCVDQQKYRGVAALKARLRYAITPMAIIDLLAILPFYLAFFVSIDLRFLRVVRLLRVFKLTRYSGAMNLVLSVFKDEAHAFFASFGVLIILLILASSGIYFLEHQQQPDNFGSIPESMWWAMTTLTTVGYGDVVPITPMGKVFGGLITIIGMGMVALPAGILASGFAEQIHRRRSIYQRRLQRIFGDGVVTRSESLSLEQLRERLGLTHEEVEELTHEYLQHYQDSLRQCPHCKQPLITQRQTDR